MFDLFGTTREKKFDEMIKAAEESEKMFTQSADKLIFMLGILPDAWLSNSTLVSCRDFFRHLLTWQKYSLSEVQLEEIRLRSKEIEDLEKEFNGVLGSIQAEQSDQQDSSKSIREISQKAELQGDFCKQLIERLKDQNPLLDMFFPEKSVTLSWK